MNVGCKAAPAVVTKSIRPAPGELLRIDGLALVLKAHALQNGAAMEQSAKVIRRLSSSDEIGAQRCFSG